MGALRRGRDGGAARVGQAEERAAKVGITVRVPRPKLCTDNGAMVAALGALLVERDVDPSPLDLAADSSMSLT